MLEDMAENRESKMKMKSNKRKLKSGVFCCFFIFRHLLESATSSTNFNFFKLKLINLSLSQSQV